MLDIEQERLEFAEWKERYALTCEPNYSKQTEADCFAVWLAAKSSLLERLQVAEDAAKDAGRWHETLLHVGGTYNLDGMPKFTLRHIKPIKGINILNGSVSGYFTDAIDAAIAARRLTP